VTQRMCRACGNWHDLDEPWPAACSRHFVSRGTAPYVISDNMDPLKHHGTGEILTSKRAFSKATRASGCIEIGNEVMPARKPIVLDKGKRRDDIRRTIYELRNGIRRD
jgi:hypothetical protein